jgi:hypothetical protein
VEERLSILVIVIFVQNVSEIEFIRRNNMKDETKDSLIVWGGFFAVVVVIATVLLTAGNYARQSSIDHEEALKSCFSQKIDPMWCYKNVK